MFCQLSCVGRMRSCEILRTTDVAGQTLPPLNVPTRSRGHSGQSLYAKGATTQPPSSWLESVPSRSWKISLYGSTHFTRTFELMNFMRP